jgi:hypothetical protein
MDETPRLDQRLVEFDFRPERLSEQVLALAFIKLVGDGSNVPTVSDDVILEDRNRQQSFVQEVVS